MRRVGSVWWCVVDGYEGVASAWWCVVCEYDAGW